MKHALRLLSVFLLVAATSSWADSSLEEASVDAAPVHNAQPINGEREALREHPEAIVLYEKPSKSSRVIATFSPGVPIITIIERNGWVKIASSEDGTVGWVQAHVLPANGIYTKTITTNNATDGTGYNVVQYTGTLKLNREQVQNMLKRLRVQQAAFQQAVTQMLQSSEQQFNDMSRQFNAITTQMWQESDVAAEEPVITPADKSGPRPDPTELNTEEEKLTRTSETPSAAAATTAKVSAAPTQPANNNKGWWQKLFDEGKQSVQGKK